ncbi:MAG: hypothetical protein IJV64_07880 [Oscillospiraceae bacterium]|nr:hypothetical protein [Oscillospiraceae bacterium]
MRLSPVPYTGGIAGTRQSAWVGLDHTPGAQGGALYDMRNLTGRLYPLLASREKRHTLRTLSGAPNGLYKADSLYYVEGAILCDTTSGLLTPLPGGANAERVMVALGKRLVIWPDKVVYTEEGGLAPIERRAAGVSCVIRDGSYAGEDAEANTVYAAGVLWSDYFRAGDAVTISGAVVHPENNRTAVIRELDGHELRFYENTFVIGSGGDSETLTLARTAPDLDFLCVNENRVWGCKDDTIWCSKLGDPFNWNVFDGISTDSWSVETGTPGKFTACAAYMGYPCFFKEDRVFKVYGNRPSNFESMGGVATLGVTPGNHNSLAIAGETLFYLSRAGIVAYRGGTPQSVGEALGAEKYHDAVAGSDGVRYYVSLLDGGGNPALFVYDTLRGFWHREDGTRLKFTAYDKGLVGLTEGGDMLLLGVPEEVPEGATEENSVAWSAEFADFTADSFSGKYPVRLRLRFEGETGAVITAAIRYDSAGDWQEVTELGAGAKRAVYLALPIRRCDHFRLKLAGTGAVRLYAMAWELYEENYTRK